MSKSPKKYKLLGRDHVGFDENGQRKTFVTGDMVPLSDEQFEAFGNKFEESKSSPAEKPLTATQPQNKNDPEPVPAPAAEVKPAEPTKPATPVAATPTTPTTTKS